MEREGFPQSQQREEEEAGTARVGEQETADSGEVPGSEPAEEARDPRSVGNFRQTKEASEETGGTPEANTEETEHRQELQRLPKTE